MNSDYDAIIPIILILMVFFSFLLLLFISYEVVHSAATWFLGNSCLFHFGCYMYTAAFMAKSRCA